MTEISVDQNLIRSLAIPPRPELVTALFQEMSRDEPDLPRVTRQICLDVGLSAAMMKVVNSPAFGLRVKARSVTQAIGLLGLRNVANIATGLVIRQSLGGVKRDMERFWDTSEKVALICSYLARRLRGIPADEAFTAGLFHDCGIPLLASRFPRYKEALAEANRNADTSFFDVEEKAVGAHHGAVGYFLARSWGLHGDICRAILRHHDPDAFVSEDVGDMARNHIGLFHLAQHIHHLRMRSTVDIEWIKFEPAVLDHFALTEEDFINLVDGAQDELDDQFAAAA